MEKTAVIDTSRNLCRLIGETGSREPDVVEVTKEFGGSRIHFH